MLREEGYDLGLGLVAFSGEAEGMEVKGITTDPVQFQNWLYGLRTEGGGDIAESIYEALMAALERVDYRWFAKKHFILATDAPPHDKDIDGRSPYSLDEVIETLRKKGIAVTVLGIDHLPIKQLAWGTGGQWIRIPGSGYLESLPQTPPQKDLAWLEGACLLEGGKLKQRITVHLSDPNPGRLALRVKVLGPDGRKLFEREMRVDLPESPTGFVTLSPEIDLKNLARSKGTYTVIWRLSDGRREALLRSYLDIP
ncbi:hypothetical protein DRP77_03630 [Candidatus Poribacteria bacterium]|nr:MAG: hypothetical protein DRP77_03630 [Candidatus Poribacteria bacterium]